MTLIFDLIYFRGAIPVESVMDGIVYWTSQVASTTFFLLYIHQFIFIFWGSSHHHKLKKNAPFTIHKLGIIIPARNESRVIGNLIRSIQASDYPAESVRIIVLADNCTDNTAQIARDLGCTVFERFDKERVGKGFALNWIFTKLHTEPEYADLVPDAYVIFDADNLIKPNFLYEINRTYSQGYEVVTSYRNSKNYGKNWITAGYGLWFLHEARHLNNCRAMMKSNCTISGTGFLISTETVKQLNNWQFFFLTEDIQCSAVCALKGRKIGYSSQAELYDEQPETFRQSWKQRERWAKGFYQVLGKHGGGLLGKSFTRFACWDVITTIFPALFITLFVLFTQTACAIIAFSIGDVYAGTEALIAMRDFFWMFYWVLFMLGAFTTITEWRRIKTNWFKKIFYVFTLPIFMVTYLPISFVAMFKKVKWVPIEHTAATTIEEINGKTAAGAAAPGPRVEGAAPSTPPAVDKTPAGSKREE